MLPQGERVTTTSTTTELHSYHKPVLRALSLIISMWSRWFVQYHHQQQQQKHLVHRRTWRMKAGEASLGQAASLTCHLPQVRKAYLVQIICGRFRGGTIQLVGFPLRVQLHWKYCVWLGWTSCFGCGVASGHRTGQLCSGSGVYLTWCRVASLSLLKQGECILLAWKRQLYFLFCRKIWSMGTSPQERKEGRVSTFFCSMGRF